MGNLSFQGLCDNKSVKSNKPIIFEVNPFANQYASISSIVIKYIFPI